VLTPWCNFAGYFDRLIFGKLFMDYPNDPEGLFSTLDSFGNTYIGLIFTLIMFNYKNNKSALFKEWSLITFILLWFGYFLKVWCPFNKAIWSISFLFATCGWSGFTLIVCFVLYDWWENKYIKIVV